MLSTVTSFFQSNLDAVYLIYGLAFFSMGIAIFVRPRWETKFSLARVLNLLGWFGILHGINEWTDAFVLIRGRTHFIDVGRLLVLFASFIFLFEFGRQLFRLEMHKYPPRLKWFAERLVWTMNPIITLSICLFSILSHDFWQTGAILIRYFLDLPGCVLIAAGFLLYYKYEEESLAPLRVKKFFFTASASFLVYGLLSGLVVNPGHYLPATIINTSSFLNFIGIPVQVFRGACAIIAGWATVGLLNIFSVETLKRLEDEINLRKQSDQERENLNLELIRSNDKLNQLALEDAQTGLYNYRYLVEVVESELSRARRSTEPLSVIMMDIDYFKSINDVYGHRFGDLVLKQFAGILKKTVRRSDTVTRYGGEEFVIVSPGLSRKPAMILANRLLEAVNTERFGDDTNLVPIKVSIGVSTFPQDHVSKGMNLIERADRILTTAKEHGGNRVYNSGDLDDQHADISSDDENTDMTVLKEKLDKITRRANQGIIQAITAFAKKIELKDHYTDESIDKTIEYSIGIADALGLSEVEIEHIRQGAIIHDLGKVGINENILNKQTSLTDEEYEKIKEHTQIGSDIIRPITALRDILPLVYHHHERWDGKGYPLGLKGHEIPLGARVIAIADVYQALTSDRPYRKAYSREDALFIIQNDTGKQFDPMVVDAFMNMNRTAQ